jgi:GNAT superfamily N-acetyltransferase
MSELNKLASIRIRSALPSDATAVAACVKQAYEPWIAIVGQKPGPLLDDYAQVIATSQVYLAQTDHDLAGVLVLSTTDEGFLLENVAVPPAYQGSGVGRLLLARAEHEARLTGYDSIYLYTHEKMQRNIDLYAKIGYVEFARREEIGRRRVYLRKHLAP